MSLIAIISYAQLSRVRYTYAEWVSTIDSIFAETSAILLSWASPPISDVRFMKGVRRRRLTTKLKDFVEKSSTKQLGQSERLNLRFVELNIQYSALSNKWTVRDAGLLNDFLRRSSRQALIATASVRRFRFSSRGCNRLRLVLVISTEIFTDRSFQPSLYATGLF